MKLSKAISEIKAMMGSSGTSQTIEVSRAASDHYHHTDLTQSMNNKLKLSPKIEPKFQASSALKSKMSNSNRKSLANGRMDGSTEKISPTKHFDISATHQQNSHTKEVLSLSKLLISSDSESIHY